MNESYKIDQPIEKVLLKAYHIENRNRNKILFLAITAVVMASFLTVSMIYGKIQTDMLKMIRSDGMTVSAYLENGTEDSVWQLNHLPYVKETGMKKNAGKLMDDQQVCCSCIFLDPSAYEQMIVPAFVEVHGSYPQKTDEIMLSKKTLDDMGIVDPEAGMRLSLEFYWNDIFCRELTGKQDFILSGYYVDAKDTMIEEPEAYISGARLEACSIDQFPCRILIDTDRDYLDGARVEKILYRDLILKENQQVVSMDSAFSRAVTRTAGGCGAAFILCLTFVLVLFLFVYDILYLSMGKDIRQYGLLRVLGVSDRQIKKIVYIQMLQVCLAGNGAGSVVAFIIAEGILAGRISRTDISGNGEGIRIVYGCFLPVICLLVFVVVFLVVHILLKKMLNLRSMQASGYENAGRSPKRMTKEKKCWKKRYPNPILQIAWMNMMRSKKKCLLIVCSLALGCEAALVSVMIGKGADIMSDLQQNPDFKICMTYEFCTALIESSQEKEGILEEPGDFHVEDFTKTEGFLPILDKEGRESFQILNMQEDPVIIIQKTGVCETEKLKQYIKDQSSIDLDTFLNQNGVLILHRHLLSEAAKENTEKYIGTSIGIYDLVPVGTDMSGYRPVPLVNCGYLDLTDHGFPELDVMWNGEKTICMAVSEDTFEELSRYLTPRTFQLSFDVEHGREPEIKKILKQWVQEINTESVKQLSLICNSDRIVREQNYILAARYVMWTVSLIFIFMGIMNYLNIMLTDIVIRSREFTVMRNIGLTENQLKWMLTLEGLFYCMITAGILGAFGNGILYLTGKYMKGRLPYFVFQYPLSELLGILAALLLLCSLIPCSIYRLQNYGKSKTVM